MGVFDAFFDLDASVASAKTRRIVKDLERLVEERRADFHRRWRWPRWRDTVAR